MVYGVVDANDSGELHVQPGLKLERVRGRLSHIRCGKRVAFFHFGRILLTPLYLPL
jgi:hypothetical protein